MRRFRTMRIAITGASGYLGQRVALRACDQHDVWAGYYQNASRISAGSPWLVDLGSSASLLDS
ncbi:MAG: hypothetical protein MI919_43375, partial [Holophagales bacterium]|nr:hypothetical protein [Holophagales bacterium]